MKQEERQLLIRRQVEKAHHFVEKITEVIGISL